MAANDGEEKEEVVKKRSRLKKRYGRARKPVFHVEAGRQVYRNGERFIEIGRVGNTQPTTADEVVHVIADCLNRKKFKGTYDK